MVILTRNNIIRMLVNKMKASAERKKAEAKSGENLKKQAEKAKPTPEEHPKSSTVTAKDSEIEETEGKIVKPKFGGSSGAELLGTDGNILRVNFGSFSSEESKPEAKKESKLDGKNDPLERLLSWKKKERIIHRGTVRGVDFGTLVSPQIGTHSDDVQHLEGSHLVELFGDNIYGPEEYIFRFMKPPEARKLSVVGERDEHGWYQDLVNIHIPALNRKSLLPQKGPYADRDELVKLLAKKIQGNTGKMREVIERTIDLFRPYFNANLEGAFPRKLFTAPYFAFSEDLTAIPNKFPSAGNILSAKSRGIDINGTRGIAVIHMMECLTLAVATLRSIGLKAYPAIGTRPVKEGGREGIQGFQFITIIDPDSEIPMIIFTHSRDFPPIRHLEILSDTAMAGVMHAVLADIRLHHLIEHIAKMADPFTIARIRDMHAVTSTLEQSTNEGASKETTIREKERKELEDQLERILGEEITKRLDGIADQLFESHSKWQNNQYIHDVRNSLELDDASFEGHRASIFGAYRSVKLKKFAPLLEEIAKDRPHEREAIFKNQVNVLLDAAKTNPMLLTELTNIHEESEVFAIACEGRIVRRFFSKAEKANVEPKWEHFEDEEE